MLTSVCNGSWNLHAGLRGVALSAARKIERSRVATSVGVYDVESAGKARNIQPACSEWSEVEPKCIVSEPAQLPPLANDIVKINRRTKCRYRMRRGFFCSYLRYGVGDTIGIGEPGGPWPIASAPIRSKGGRNDVFCVPDLGR